MGEPTCLMRSFSHPSSASRESKEGDPFRALTESISFGRFMSESLDWEKWSTFSHNRYLEEVEQFSKPGSVAQKKAFFEAHYKKRAAMKAAALLDQPDEEELAVSNVPETETTVNHSIPEEEEEEKEEEMTVDSVPKTENIDITCPQEEIQEREHLKPVDNVENYEKVAALLETKAIKEDAVVLQKSNGAFPVNKRQISSSSQNKASKIPKPSTRSTISTQLNGGTNLKLKTKSFTGDSINNKKLTTKSVHMSINLASHSGLTSKSSIRMSKECATPKKSASERVSGISKLLPSDDKRNWSLNKSVIGGTTTGVGILQALSGDSAKSSESKAKSPIISSPFRFRSEERAAKRKEKLEEKDSSKTQVKSKVPLTRPRSPKLGRKPSSSIAVEKDSQLPRRPSVNAESSKRVIPKRNQSTTRSVTTLPRKKAHENASPNIQP